ncbi:MAG TPA: ribonuclease P protein component [Burkholderiaceae bacterium]|nr:ribonuclease P protein component [Burkholderiaceae bacterium]
MKFEILNRPTDFQAALRHRRLESSKHFDLFGFDAHQSLPRLGLVISRKAAPRAVTRNLVKRIARESARQARSLPSLDFVVRAKIGLAVDWTAAKKSKSLAAFRRELRAEVDQLLLRTTTHRSS